MKSFMPIIAVIMLVLSGFVAVAVADKRTNDVNIKQQTIILSEPTIKEAENFIKVSLKECMTLDIQMQIKMDMF